MGLGVQVHFDEDNPVHTVHDIMPGDGSSGHIPSGEWYYGTSIALIRRIDERNRWGAVSSA
ncbi:MAG: hypothetical protein CM15mP49_32620 [Actinomycetota bacterium]|nr:MAG: hypothetical protein CM15mP49_32620 [Actinomycetota bacterium]